MSRKRWLWILLAILGIFLFTYALAWLNAYQMAVRYSQDAENFYTQGDYLDALTGIKVFDKAQNKYVQLGGYLQVVHLWENSAAFPRPSIYNQAIQHVQEIISHRLTISMAEAFIQANIGLNNPYLGVVYLRLGELYQESGDVPSAVDVFKLIIDSFRSQPDLVAQAKTDLAGINQQP